jgi:type II secretion system protein C
MVSPLHLRRVLWLLTSFFIVAWLMSILEMFLPHTGVNYQQKDHFVNRHLYRISALFFEPVKAVAQTQDSSTANQATTKEEAIPLTAWTLTALYHEGNEGFAIVKVSGKTHYLNIGETHLGYTLDSIEDKSAFLKKGGKHYKLSLDIDTKMRVETKRAPSRALPPEKLNVKSLQEGVVSRAEIDRRLKRPDLIWKDIKISIYRKGGDIAGFIVRSVKHDSIFHHLGLKRGDIIVSANGNQLDSLEGVQELYKNIDKMTSLALGVKRAGKIEELTYEIK